SSAKLIRATRRIAARTHAEWVAAHVETSASGLSEANRARVAQHLRLAEELGAETTTLTGQNSADEILRYARSRNVSRIVAGKPTHARWRDFVGRSFLDELVRGSGDIDVYVISGDARDAVFSPKSVREKPKKRKAEYGAAGAVVAMTTATAWLFF